MDFGSHPNISESDVPRNPGMLFCVSPSGNPVVSYSPRSADHPDEDIRQRVLRLRQRELAVVLEKVLSDGS